MKTKTQIKLELSAKMMDWTSIKEDRFYNNIKTQNSPNVARYIWETDEYGNFFYWRDITGFCFGDDGYVHKIAKYYSNKDYNLTRTLSEAGFQNGIYLEKPIEYEELGRMRYVLYRRPFGDHGISIYERRIDNHNFRGPELLKYIADMKELIGFLETQLPDNEWPSLPKHAISGKYTHWYDFKYFGSRTKESFKQNFKNGMDSFYIKWSTFLTDDERAEIGEALCQL